MKITVLGGSGFLGSHVADELSNSNHKVTIFDKKKSKWIRKDQKMVVGDLLDIKLLDETLKNQEIVYNFAALSNLDEAIQRPAETVNVNILGAVQLLNLCKKNKIKRYVHASTVYVGGAYGSFYRCSKAATEDYIEEYKKIFDLDYSILRYGTLYGPRSDKSNGIYKIISDALENNKITYSGDPEATREYIHIVDAAKASVKILDKEFSNKIVILTGRETTKVEDLLKILSEMLNFKNKIVYADKNFMKSHTHYTRTPYSINNKLIIKYSDQIHIDLGQGLRNLIEEIKTNIK